MNLYTKMCIMQMICPHFAHANRILNIICTNNTRNIALGFLCRSGKNKNNVVESINIKIEKM